LTGAADARGLKRIDPLLLLLVFVPAALALELAHAAPMLVFAVSGLAIVPLAGLMGKATEHLSARLGAGLGGLLNASFGNAAELIIALLALRRGLHDVVKASITGSIIGNLLLVLGLAILLGGVRFERQTFNRTAAGMGATLLALSAAALIVPALFHYVATGGIGGAASVATERELSLEIAIVLFLTYLLSLVFALRTHRHVYDGHVGRQGAEALGTGHWSRRRSLGVLVLATGGVALMAEVLVGAVEATAAALGMTEVFVGVILVAIIGNAAEHSTAVLVALRNQMDLAFNIALGSSIQVALFVAPVLVFASYLIGGAPMDLLFTPFEVIAVALTVGLVSLVTMDGESHWMEGVQLLALYAILGLAFFFLP
jgi:Ca2+:H+ antiporter